MPADEQRERDELFDRAADAVAFGDLETLRELLDAEPDLVHWRSPRVHRATLLLYCGANGTESPRQRTPPNPPAVAQLRFDRGADPNDAGNFYGGGRGATTLAMVLTSVFPMEAGVDADLVRVLVRAGARLDLWRDGGPMVWAIDRGRYESARVLAEAGVAVDNLLFAAGLNRVDVLAALLARRRRRQHPPLVRHHRAPRGGEHGPPGSHEAPAAPEVPPIPAVPPVPDTSAPPEPETADGLDAQPYAATRPSVPLTMRKDPLIAWWALRVSGAP